MHFAQRLICAEKKIFSSHHFHTDLGYPGLRESGYTAIYYRIAKAIDAFVPTWLPDSFPRQRLVVRLKSGWHQVENIRTGNISSGSTSYNLVAYNQLEKIPRSGHANESMFTSKGIGKNSERIEPLIFFPMGIPDIGSMRQRGHHAIKFAGRAHFDDPYLFDEHFLFK